MTVKNPWFAALDGGKPASAPAPQGGTVQRLAKPSDLFSLIGSGGPPKEAHVAPGSQSSLFDALPPVESASEEAKAKAKAEAEAKAKEAKAKAEAEAKAKAEAEAKAKAEATPAPPAPPPATSPASAVFASLSTQPNPETKPQG